MRDAIVFRRFSVFVWTDENDSMCYVGTRIFSQTEEKNSPFSKISGYLWTGPKS